MFASCPGKFGAKTHTQDLWLFLISETGLKFLKWTQGDFYWPLTRPSRLAALIQRGQKSTGGKTCYAQMPGTTTWRKNARQVLLQKWIGDRGLGWLPVMAGVGWQGKRKKISRLKTYWTYFSRIRQSLENSSATMCFASFPENRKQKFTHSLSQY